MSRSHNDASRERATKLDAEARVSSYSICKECRTPFDNPHTGQTMISDKRWIKYVGADGQYESESSFDIDKDLVLSSADDDRETNPPY